MACRTAPVVTLALLLLACSEAAPPDAGPVPDRIAWDDRVANADARVIGQAPLAASLTGKSVEELRQQMEMAARTPP